MPITNWLSEEEAEIIGVLDDSDDNFFYGTDLTLAVSDAIAVAVPVITVSEPVTSFPEQLELQSYMVADFL